MCSLSLELNYSVQASVLALYRKVQREGRKLRGETRVQMLTYARDEFERHGFSPRIKFAFLLIFSCYASLVLGDLPAFPRLTDVYTRCTAVIPLRFTAGTEP
jgi:hypothetical protein